MEHSIKSDLQQVGELLLQLGGDAGDVSGDLSQEQIDTVVTRIKEAADKVWGKLAIAVAGFYVLLMAFCSHRGSVQFRPAIIR